MSKHIKPPAIKNGNRISLAEVVNYDMNPPIFSLERVQNGVHCFSQLETADKAQFAEAIFKRKMLMWSQIKNVGRHGLGFEKISKNTIKATLPPFIKDDREHFIAFRFNELKPMVGYRVNDVFYVLWFDHDYTLYDH
jgi:hypothetical protein